VIREGDDLINIVAESLAEAQLKEGFTLNDMDVVGVTEAVVARAQGNYATVDAICADVRKKMRSDEFSVVFPILSRNRFAVCLKGIAKAARKINLVLSYPADEVGNHLFDEGLLYEKGVNPWSDEISLERYRELFGYPVHAVTGMEYVSFYKKIIEDYGAGCEVILCNDVDKIVNKCGHILLCRIHERDRIKKRFYDAGAHSVLMLTDILNAKNPANPAAHGEGYNELYGLLGSNTSTDERVKLFPRDCLAFTTGLQKRLVEMTGAQLEVLIYGDGAFKDPVSKIWELADPVVSPAYSAGLEGMPNEVKLKYLADSAYTSLSGDQLTEAIRQKIGDETDKDDDEREPTLSLGTTPRRYVDLLGSLCDLTSGSGDKGTPVVLIQGYFDNYAVDTSSSQSSARIKSVKNKKAG